MLFNKVLDVIVTSVLKLEMTSNKINSILKDTQLAFAMNSKHALRIRFSEDPKVISEKTF